MLPLNAWRRAHSGRRSRLYVEQQADPVEQSFGYKKQKNSSRRKEGVIRMQTVAQNPAKQYS